MPTTFSLTVDCDYTGLRAPNGQPYNYPAPVYVRNTFVELKPGRDPSLDEFFEERRIHSCPASWGPSLGKFRLDDEAPLASSRTTACGSASDDSNAASTPPRELSDEVEDTSPGVTPRGVATNADRAQSASLMPSSCAALRKTLSDYRHSPASQQRLADHMHRQAAPSSAGAARVPIREFVPAPVSNSETTGYYGNYTDYSDGYNTGYNDGSDNAFDNGYDPEYANAYANSYQGGYAQSVDGYQPVQACYPMPSPEDPAPQVLQLSASIMTGIQQQQPRGYHPQGNPAHQIHAASSVQPQSLAAAGNENMLAFPTRGSINHGLGRCKPCAFVFTKGCGNGFECPFCHLCDPGEKKKRRKDKLDARRVVRELRQVLPFGGPGFNRHTPAS